MTSYSNIFVCFLSFSVNYYFSIFILQVSDFSHKQFKLLSFCILKFFFSLLTGVSMLLNHQTNPPVTLLGRYR